MAASENFLKSQEQCKLALSFFMLFLLVAIVVTKATRAAARPVITISLQLILRVHMDMCDHILFYYLG